MTDQRNRQFDRRFHDVIHGNSKLDLRPNPCRLFLQGLCIQADPVRCVEQIVASPHGLEAVQQAIRVDTGIEALNGLASQVLEYLLRAQGIGGGVLQSVIIKVVDPPILWNAFHKAFEDGTLDNQAQLVFVNLLSYLLQLSNIDTTSYRHIASRPSILDKILTSDQQEIREAGYLIKHILGATSAASVAEGSEAPGGRHDNDFADFRKIAIIPTADELLSQKRPALRPASLLDDPDGKETRVADYLDIMFRLLREDMMHELKEEVDIALKKKQGRHRGLVISGMKLISAYASPDKQNTHWGIMLQCYADLPIFKDVKDDDRKTFLTEDHRGSKLLRHQSLACIVADNTILSLGVIHRDEELLARKPPVVVLQIEGQISTSKALLQLKVAKYIRLIQIDVALFAFEPVLKALQKINIMPLSEEILLWEEGVSTISPVVTIPEIASQLGRYPSMDLQGLLRTPKSIKLDASQAQSLLAGLNQRVSLIQGPPGTGKSFIGALLAKALHDFTDQTILVVCYTNHALDQFLNDLMDIGIDSENIVRLGGRHNSAVSHLSIHNLAKEKYVRSKAQWTLVDATKEQVNHFNQRLHDSFKDFLSARVDTNTILSYIEFEDPDYFEAFQVPGRANGMNIIGPKKTVVDDRFLISRWVRGQDAWNFKNEPNVQSAAHIWSMDPALRREKVDNWKLGIMKEIVEAICVSGKGFNDGQDDLSRKFGESVVAQLKSKRIIGCTTTGAAKFTEDLRAVSPDVLLVEEAGEILESHIITALGPNTKQMILIGDHQQLRPKVNNYNLTVEKGEGFDLNRSLFERLVRKGFPHVTLSVQHRMRPEISAFIRALTYPDLEDSPKTQNRDDIRGLQSNVVFLNHSHAEDEDERISDRGDGGTMSSKHNTFEVQMVLKVVRYLAQQGYGSDNIVILTPYLGQLSMLRDELQNETDAVLNDLDSKDLSKAGLLSSTNTNKRKTRIRLATIDNYQGEESDIVVASLCRSNSTNTIGFMSSPERLNVLISRARNGLILIGNSSTFELSKKGGELWSKFLNLVRSGGYMYSGLPVRCQRHPSWTREMQQPDEFDVYSPDGGCTESCGMLLSCQHPCTLKCHPIRTTPNQSNVHTTMQCKAPFSDPCPDGTHTLTWKCHQGRPAKCSQCEKEAKRLEKQAQLDIAAQDKRQKAQREHDLRMTELDAKLQYEKEGLADVQKAKEREEEARRKKKEIEDVKQKAKKAALKAAAKVNPPTSQTATQTRSKPTGDTSTLSQNQPANQDAPRPKVQSAARDKWEYQKRAEGVENEAIDKIMDMTGLEEVKEQILRIKAKIDTMKRQGVAINKERLNLVLLGNPGTGKTTVARLYAQFLESIEVLPGDAFIETTGSSLANEGVTGAKKFVDDALKAGGGAIFIDEAYQLVSEYDQSGRPVLDFLLAEMENRVGTLMFILAGYNKEMEKFFEHNPGIPSRVPYSLQFSDYKDAELLTMLEDMVSKRYKGQMQVEDGIRGLYARIAVRRLGRGRGRPGFGNARALQNMFSKICERQAERVEKTRRAGGSADDFLMSKEDLIGPDPCQVLPQSAAWTELEGLIGLESVKTSVRNFFALIETNYHRELEEKEPMQMSLNRVFLGSPGTGKTSVAKLYGKVLAELGLLSNGEVVVKNPADFVGGYVGHSEKQTKAILSSTIGKVLIIDEAYMLYSKNTGQDPFKTSVIDTMVAEIQSVPGEDRCVLLLGYKEQMEEMFQNVNPGLARRFPIENAFTFEDFNETQLMQILDHKLKNQDLSATDDAKRVARDLLARMKNRPNFGNAGEVENMLGLAKARYQNRMVSIPPNKRAQVIFEPQDFDPDHKRDQNASANLAKLFEDVVGCEDVIKKLENYQKIARAMKAQGLDMRTQIPSNFIFKGLPGTGKTSTARKLGQVYYDMGFLSSTEVVECSASDLVGQYVGQTGPKTKAVFEKALGKVLFVDEAYRLSEGHFAKEAMDEIVGLMTQERFMNKLIIILAGYEHQMNALLSVNPGLSSRFAEEINFQNMTADQCLTLLDKDLRKSGIVVAELTDPDSSEYPEMKSIIESMSGLSSWGNARDMKTIGKRMVQQAFSNAANNFGQPASLTVDEAVSILRSTWDEQRGRLNMPTMGRSYQSNASLPPMASFSGPAPPPPPTNASSATHTSKPPPLPQRKSPDTESARRKVRSKVQTPSSTTTSDESSRGSSPGPESLVCPRDRGVSDETWNQLQADKAAEVERRRRAIEEEQILQRKLELATNEQRRAEKDARVLENEKRRAGGDPAKLAEVEKRIDEAKKCEAAVKAARERAVTELKRKQREEAERLKQMEEARKKLKAVGLCPMGYEWIKQASGWRCAGGSHYMSDGELGL
ncbi:P-loop containing nucleoside triphosphate hydrolase protein [Scleroderma yunnanense]